MGIIKHHLEIRQVCIQIPSIQLDRIELVWSPGRLRYLPYELNRLRKIGINGRSYYEGWAEPDYENPIMPCLGWLGEHGVLRGH